MNSVCLIAVMNTTLIRRTMREFEDTQGR